ncbi:hypothetical protein EYF80_046203 [Liparis tanakae]|uniref:Uncharacterized protein n=1 Tax=Liparis tanakae TaxID=230148 RepID=A0A4Z2FRX8_9TELE|nr:hypothetical protein EYF80_046203 [Liparis tanakae]
MLHLENLRGCWTLRRENMVRMSRSWRSRHITTEERLWDRDPAMDQLVPYCGHSTEQVLSTCSHSLMQSDAHCETENLTSLTPTPRLPEHMPPKYAALLLR